MVAGTWVRRRMEWREELMEELKVEWREEWREELKIEWREE